MTTAHRQIVCQLDQLPVGEVICVDTPQGEVAVFHSEAGLRAVANRCTHGDSELSDGLLDGDTIECPAHFGRFCLSTGRPLGLPATEPLERWVVHIENGSVVLDGPEQGDS